jgi:drug/metabolite transporter (DMT)-like permease
LYGFCNNATFFFLAYAAMSMSVLELGLIQSTVPLVTFIFEQFPEGVWARLTGGKRTKEKGWGAGATLTRMIGLCVGVLSVWVVLLQQAENERVNGNQKDPLPYVLCFGGVVSWSFSIVFWGRTRTDSETGRQIPPELGAFATVFVALLLGGVLMATFDNLFPPKGFSEHFHFFDHMTWRSAVALLYMGILSGFVNGLAYLALANLSDT